MSESILILLLTPFVLIGGVILLSDGECYYCGSRLKKPIVRHGGKKHCGCDIKVYKHQ
jgi:hypothetical protein